jgi:hypothetical protein
MLRIVRLLDIPQAIFDSYNSSPSPDILSPFPQEVWLMVARYLPAQSKISLAMTNKHFPAITSDICLRVDIDAVLERGERLMPDRELSPLALIPPPVFWSRDDRVDDPEDHWSIRWSMACSHCA